MKPAIKQILSNHKVLCCILLICTTFLCVDITGCFNNKTPDRSYFSIDYTLGTQPKQNSPKYNASIVVQNITSALAYDRQEIGYRSNPYEFQYYWYRLWASKPRKMLRELITNHLRYTQLFSHVTPTIEDRLPDYALDVDIQAIEELDASATEWYAHLALQFTLQRVSDNKVVWNYSFDTKRPVASNQPVYVVKAMSELLDEELVKAFDDMDKTLSRKMKSQKSSEPPVEPQENIEINDSSALEESEDQPRATLKNQKNSSHQQ